ncbi:MAG: hypothetical protein JST00_06705 [Deltaproteobacteria bacterium]|nr:hypothetical protein [Deltaproteobacteria bacterium]
MKRRARRAPALAGLLVASALASTSACSGEDANVVPGRKDASTAKEGQEGGPCRATGTGCDPGLVCVGDLCTGDGRPDAVAGDGSPVDGPSGDAAACTSAGPPTAGACAVGGCFCPGTSACFAPTAAVACCAGPVTCTTNGTGNPDSGACTYKHPLLDAGARFCGSGECYCAKNDSCYALASVVDCCAGDRVVCY